MNTYISSNIGTIAILFSSVIIIQFLIIFMIMRRIKMLMSITSWLLLFERLISVVFKAEIEEFINTKEKEFAEAVMQHKRKQSLYEMHKNNVSSSPIRSSDRW